MTVLFSPALTQHVDKHCVTIWENLPRYKNVWAWELADAKKYDEPVPYKHSKGAVVWVKLTKLSDFQEARKKEEKENKRPQKNQ